MSNWSFVPGNSPALITEHFTVIVGAADAQHFIEKLRDTTTVSAALDVLLADGLTGTPDFCLCKIAENSVQAYVRGDCSLRVEADWVDSATISGAGVRSWREIAYEGVSRVAMIAPESETDTQTSIRQTLPERIPAKEGTHQVSLLVYELRVPGTSMLTAEVPRLSRADLRKRVSTVAPPAVLDAFPDDLFDPNPASRTSRESSNTAKNQAVDQEAPQDALQYDDLFGATQNITVEQAAVRTNEPESGGNPDHSAHDHLSAVLCIEGHASPPDRKRCGVCHTPLLSEEMVRVARPEFGVIVLPDSTQIPIDGVLLLGRRPQPDSFSDGEPAPTLVLVHDPNGDVSRTHIRVRVEGWSVLIEDLRSTNGTILISQNGSERRLRANEPCVVTDGDIADLGGGARVQFRGMA